MQQIYSNTTKVLVDTKQGSNLLYLPLDKIIQQSNSANGVTPVSPSDAAHNATSTTTTNPAAAASADARARDGRSRDRDGR